MDVRGEINDMVRENLIVTVVSLFLMGLFVVLAFLVSGDSREIALLGVVIFGSVALAYGLQARRFKRKAGL